MQIPYQFMGGDVTSLVAFIPGDALPVTMSGDNRNFAEAVKLLGEAAAGAEVSLDRIRQLFDPATEVGRRFERLSERVTVVGGKVCFDGDPVHGALQEQILRHLEADEDFEPLVIFYENLAQNPSPGSVEQLYEWVARNDFQITADGMIVAYKGVRSDGNGGFTSVKSGRAIVNGEVVSGLIPNAVGDTIEMPRSEVVDDPFSLCSTGLHVGTYSYARTWGSDGAMLRVEVNPRDVVSVPNDANGEKVRVCRYYVEEVMESAPTDTSPVWEPKPEEEDWGDGEDYEF